MPVIAASALLCLFQSPPCDVAGTLICSGHVPYPELGTSGGIHHCAVDDHLWLWCTPRDPQRITWWLGGESTSALFWYLPYTCIDSRTTFKVGAPFMSTGTHWERVMVWGDPALSGVNITFQAVSRSEVGSIATTPGRVILMP